MTPKVRERKKKGGGKNRFAAAFAHSRVEVGFLLLRQQGGRSDLNSDYIKVHNNAGNRLGDAPQAGGAECQSRGGATLWAMWGVAT